jgi:hypothetical protein
MKRKLYILFVLLLPMLATAQRGAVQVLDPCCEGHAFSIRIPIRVHDSITVQYEWYRNNVLIPGTQKVLMSGEKIIAVSIPAELAYGDSVVYHFRYRLDDGYPEWTASPGYFVTYATEPPVASAITGDTLVCPGAVGIAYSVVNAWSDSYDWQLPPDWTIMSGWGTHQITVRAGATAGNVKVTPSNGCGVGVYSELFVNMSSARALTLTPTESSGATSQTLCDAAISEMALTPSGGSVTGRSIAWTPRAPAGVSVNLNSVPLTISGSLTEYGAFSYVIIVTGLASYCPGTAIGTIKRNGVKTGGTLSVAPDKSCISGVANAGNISVTPYVCTSGGIRTTGDISVAPYVCIGGGVKTAGTISVRAY